MVRSGIAASFLMLVDLVNFVIYGLLITFLTQDSTTAELTFFSGTEFPCRSLPVNVVS